MAVDFVIPKVGENISEATIVDWLVEDGAEVNEGDDILELETDKAVIPVPANASGTLRIGPFGAGDVAPIGAVVATIGARDSAFAPAAESPAPAEAAPADTAPPPDTAPAGTAADAAAKATPVAQKMAADMGVKLADISGSGSRGKVTKADVLAATQPESAPVESETAPPRVSAVADAAPAPPVAPIAPADTADDAADDVQERIPVKGIRGIIARRMGESVHTTARVTLVSEVDATELVAMREQLKARYKDEWGFAPGYNELLALITAHALRQFPFMNARFTPAGDQIEILRPVNIGVAVDTERGLLVPVLRDVDRKGLQEIGREFRELVQRARAGKSRPDDLTGGTFTISNLGMHRVDAFTPVINMPEAAILGVGRIVEKAAVKDGQIVPRKMLTLSLVFDHRLVDGAPAARFLDSICEMIEEPYLLFLTRK
ncbi:MAG: 2-oxo acid dehydrogenase subunit E2 [Chloroflexi bacterium]|nr:MAG: 2-oxo acid dehydrogenase subunit E2 [Chloroflexota bacterium]